MAIVALSNLPWWTSDADLENLCTQVHPPSAQNITSIRFATDALSGKSLGRAAISLSDSTLAKPLSEAIEKDPPPSSSTTPVSIAVLNADDQSALTTFFNPPTPKRSQPHASTTTNAPFPNVPIPPPFPFQNPMFPPALPIPPNLPHPNLIPPIMWMPPPPTTNAPDRAHPDRKPPSSNSASNRPPSPEATDARRKPSHRQQRDRDNHSNLDSLRDRNERLIITERGERALVLRPDQDSLDRDPRRRGDRLDKDHDLQPRERELHIPEEVKERLRERRENERYSRRRARERERERDWFSHRSSSQSPSGYNSRDLERTRDHDREWEREKDRDGEWGRDRNRDREKDWDRERDRDRERTRDRERHRERHRDRDRERDRHRARDRDHDLVPSPYGDLERDRSLSPDWSDERRTKRRRPVEYDTLHDTEGTWRGRAAPPGLDEELGKDSEERRRARKRGGRSRRRGYGGSSTTIVGVGSDAVISGVTRGSEGRTISKRARLSRR